MHDRRGDPARSGTSLFVGFHVARAACRALGLALGNVQVGGDAISLWGWKAHDYLRVTTTQKLARAVTRFDREKTMQPDSFRLHLTPFPVQGE
jgi:hypothetical protein